jgi:16S rRNA (adenine1518-N6/adenine1519-N6)-dimethyltransferase
MSFGFMRTPLGQNFLINEGIAQKIAQLADIKDGNILEIGPGKGILTKYLARKAKKVLAIELDRNLSAELEERNYKNTEIMRDDILKINLPRLIEEKNFEEYEVVANLPYYITSKIIRLLLETKHPPQEMVLMVQKEVGERIVARDGKESILSISVKFYAEPEILFFVPKENFEPAPEVDSAVIRIKRKQNIPNVDIDRFFQIVRIGFSAKRKTLVNNLASGLHLPKEEIAQILEKSSLEPDVRAEKLSIADWLRLYDLFV